MVTFKMCSLKNTILECDQAANMKEKENYIVRISTSALNVRSTVLQNTRFRQNGSFAGTDSQGGRIREKLPFFFFSRMGHSN